MAKRICYVLLALLLPAVLASCSSDSAAAGKGGGREEKKELRKVRLTKAEMARLSRTVAVSGTLAADQEAELGIKVAGRVAEIRVDLGDPVRRGQVLARLVPTDLELRVQSAETALQQARARLGLPPQGPDRIVDPQETALVRQAVATLKQAQLTRNRMSSLFEQQLIPQADFDAAEAALGVADGRYQEAIEEARNRQAVLAQRRSELDIARRQLADSILTAPFDGRIRERRVAIGDYVAVGDPVMVLVRVHPLRLQLAVPEREATSVRIGQPVRLSVEGDAEEHSGRVARISPSFSEENRTLLVEAEVPNQDGSLRPGSFARAEIVTQAAEPAVLVPTSSVVTFAGIDKVMGVEAGKAVEMPVKLGRRSGDQVEILSGVAAGDSVVVEPGNLTGGEPVEVE